ncbi:MAG: DUF1648 domain-containing protein [Armatimonadota bacterium]
MKIKLHHPLWMHIPAVAILILLIVKIQQALPLPAQAPVHFGASGQPDRIGSPWELVYATIGLSILYIAISVFFDEMWARHEKQKQFNWLSLFDEITVGLLGGILIDYLRMLKTDDFMFRFPWNAVLMLTIPAVILAIGLDFLRKFNPQEEPAITKDTAELEEKLAERVSAGQPMMHWESQHMPMLSIAMVIAGVGFLIAAVLTIGSGAAPYGLLLNGLLFIAIAVIFHGMAVTVTPNRLLVKLETTGIKLLTINMDDIAEVETHTFSPLADFGGWGIRFNTKMRGYYWRGNRGVLLTLKNGRKILIGSDDPERLAAVVKGMKEK